MDSIILYITVFLIVQILSSLSNILNKSKHTVMARILYILGLSIIIFISGFRYYVGTDYKNYIREYEYVSGIDLEYISNYRLEVGNILVYKLLYLISANPQVMIFTYSLLTIIITYIAINKIFKDREYSIAPFIFFTVFLAFTYNGIRQGLAISIGLLAISYLKEHKLKKFLLTSIVAFLFHSSAIILIPYGLIVYFSKNKKILIRTVLFSTVIGFILIIAPQVITRISVLSRYAAYLIPDNLQKFSITNLLLISPVIVMLILCWKKMNKYEDGNIVVLALWINGIILDLIGNVARYVNRISLYFTICLVCVVPIIIKSFESKKVRYVLTIIFTIYFIAYFIFDFYIRGRQEIFPYRNIFFAR